jgi:tetratricopeptide (TPR) repeat protein
MDIRVILESLEKANAIDDFLTFAPVVGPGAVISNNLEWSSKFSGGRTAFYNGDYKLAAQIFRELDESLPGHDKFLTPAKINETFCWLRLGKFPEYIRQYEPLVIQGKVYGVVLWNLAVAYCRMDKTVEAELCLKKWLGSPAPQFLGKGYMLLSILQLRSGKTDDAIDSFHNAWKIDKDFCIRTILKHLGPEMTRRALGAEVFVEVPAKKEPQIVAKEEVLSTLQELLVPRAPGKYPQVAQQLSEFEYQSGYIAALEKFGDGDVDEALRIIESLLKGTGERGALLWTKAACLLARRQWKEGIALIEDQLGDTTLPGGVLWNATCAYFNIGNYESALSTIQKCIEGEYRSSPTAWLVQGLLAHLCGKSSLRNDAIKEAIKVSPKQLVYYVGLLKQIGVDLEGLPSEERRVLIVEDEELVAKHDGVVNNARMLLNKRNPLEAAEQFLQLAPESIADIPEVGDITFKPAFLPTCPAKLYDYKEIFLTGVAAFQRKAYEEAIQRFEDLYSKTDRSYEATVNLAASLIATERYSRAIDILLDAIERRKYGGAYAIRNLISAYIRSGKPEDAFPWFSKLLEVSAKEYFNFVQMAYVAQLIGRKEDIATALFNACTVTLAEPSIRLKGAAVRACLEVKDYDRAIALVKYFVKETPLPYVVAGVTRPIMPAKDCMGYSQMSRQYQKFEQYRDARAALAYFQEVYSAREVDYSASIDEKTVDGLFNACMFYGRSLFWNQEFEKAHEVLRQAFSILTDHSSYYSPRELSKRYFALTNVYVQRRHYFWALELCERGLEADSENKGLLRLHEQIKQKIEEIPERSREAIKELGELPLSTAEKTADFVGLLPRASQLIQALPQDFPDSRKVVVDLSDLINAVIGLDTVPIIDRKKEIAKQREIVAKIEQDLPLCLPRAFISALLPVLRGIKKTLDEFQARSVCPEFTLVLERVSYYRENEASLVYKLRNVGAADIHKLTMKVESALHEKWAPVMEEQSFETVKKDELLWIDWPIHLDFIPEPELVIRPKVSLHFTGGSLRGEFVEQIIDDQETKLVPFVDISVDYPVVALRPEESSKLYGRETLLRTLKNTFTRSGQTRIPFLEGVRKVGKTSILYFLANRLTDPILPVYINLDTTWTNPYQLFAKRISDEIASRTGVKMEDLSKILAKDDLDRFLMDAIQRTGIKHIVLLLDEFHAVVDRIEQGSLPSGFLGDLRDIYQNPKRLISVAFADWYLVDELKSRVRAQLWTDFAREPVSFLNELDTREAILSPAQDSPVRFERDVVSRIYHWTNGYPWHIQWICSELINHLNTQKRYVAIPQDIDLIAQRLLREDRLFNEGVCRPERISRNSQAVIYGVLEAVQGARGDICSWFDREIALAMRLPFDVKCEVARLVQIEIFQERGNQLQFCSPLHAMWFETKRKKGVDIHGESLGEQAEEGKQPLLTPIPEDPASEIRRKCDYLMHLKSQLRQALAAEQQIFKNIEMPGEWADACVVVRTQESWKVFIKALRNLFVEDMRERLDSWVDRKKYPELNRELHSIRLRRNYVEHPVSVDGREEEERCRLEDIGKRLPTSANDWLILQLKALDRLGRAIEATIEQIARS